MALSAGDKLGPYEIVSILGKGGMGEVYRAHDPRTGRDVAVKVSAERFNERFDREVRAVAALNHPNICTLFDVGPNYLVMELVEGEAPRGPMPLEEALRIAQQIALALEEAHDKGIVHRDLKPANIKVKPDGTVKVLDFGLAKIAQAEARATSEDSPTISMAATQMGMILGTAGYMAPEQARGKPVDKRADIWAFGVVFYEILMGQRLFEGEDITETLAKVVNERPDLSDVPVQVRRLLRTCLEKDPRKRLQAIGDMRLLLEEPPAPAVVVTQPAVANRFTKLWPVAAGLLFLVAAGLAWVHLREQPPVASLDRFEIFAPEKNTFGPFLALSPDGRKVAFAAEGPDGSRHLWVRPLDSLEARAVADLSNNGSFPFWSPDSRFIGFQNGGKLKKVDVSGGSPQTLCDVPSQFLGGAWNQDGVIIFGRAGSGVWQVAEAGGTPSPVTKPAEVQDSTPSFLPDGRHFVYFHLTGSPDKVGIFLGSLDAKPEQQNSQRLLATTYQPVYVPSAESGKKGYILYVRDTTLVAQPFDTSRLELAGEGIPIAEQIGRAGTDTLAYFSASANGILAYRTGSAGGSTHLTWYDRQGKPLESAGPPGDYASLALSPDGSRVAVERRDPNNSSDLWLAESAGIGSTRFTVDHGRDDGPVWSWDGSRIAFVSEREGGFNLYTKLSNNSGNEGAVLKLKPRTYTNDWSRDGRYLLYSVQDPKNNFDLWVLPMAPANGVSSDPPKPELFLGTQFSERQGKFSPDGKWIVYSSDKSGRNEIYVRPFPRSDTGGEWQISNGGGYQARWSRDGKEIFYIGPGQKMIAAEISTTPVFKNKPARELFGAAFAYASTNNLGWDVDASGRFLINTPAGQSTSVPITLVLNWQAGLKKPGN